MFISFLLFYILHPINLRFFGESVQTSYACRMKINNEIYEIRILTYIDEQMRMKRYAKRSIESYIYWIKSYIIFNKKKHPKDCYNKEVEAFLSYLSNTKNVAPKTQALTLNALSFLYKEILKPLTLELNFNRSHIQTKLSTVLTTIEIKALLTLVNANNLLQCSH